MGRYRKILITPGLVMKKASFLFSLVSVVSCFLFPMTIFSLEQDVIFLDAEGTALIKSDDFASARDDAINDALQRAVSLATGRLLAPKIVDEKYNTLKEKIFIKADEYIQNYRIMSEKALAGAYAVNIRAAVTLEGIKNDLLKLGFLQALQKKPQVLPVNLTVRGIKSYRDYVKLREFIQKSLNGVTGVHQKSLEWGATVMEVEIQGGAKALIAELAKITQFPVQSRLTGNNAVEVIF